MSTTTSVKESTWTFSCQEHPTYRWTKNKCGPGFIGRGVLMFHGELGGLPASIDVYGEKRLSETPQEYQDWYRQRYTPECNCPMSMLQVVAEHGDWQNT